MRWQRSWPPMWSMPPCTWPPLWPPSTSCCSRGVTSSLTKCRIQGPCRRTSRDGSSSLCATDYGGFISTLGATPEDPMKKKNISRKTTAHNGTVMFLSRGSTPPVELLQSLNILIFQNVLMRSHLLQDLTYGLTDGWWMLTDTERHRDLRWRLGSTSEQCITVESFINWSF